MRKRKRSSSRQWQRQRQRQLATINCRAIWRRAASISISVSPFHSLPSSCPCCLTHGPPCAAVSFCAFVVLASFCCFNVQFFWMLFTFRGWPQKRKYFIAAQVRLKSLLGARLLCKIHKGGSTAEGWMWGELSCVGPELTRLPLPAANWLNLKRAKRRLTKN